MPAWSPPLHTLACSTTNTPARFHTFVLPACTWNRAAPKVHFQAECEPCQLWRDCRQYRYRPRMKTTIPQVSIVGALLQGLGVGQGRTKETSLHPFALHPHLGQPHAQIRRWISTKQFHEWENLLAALNSCQSRQHGLSGHEVERTDPVDGHNCRLGVQLTHCLQCVCHIFASGPRRQRMLKRGCGMFNFAQAGRQFWRLTDESRPLPQYSSLFFSVFAKRSTDLCATHLRRFQGCHLWRTIFPP